MPKPEAVDCCDLIRSPCCRWCCRSSCTVILIATLLTIGAPATMAMLAWRVLPDFESSAILPGIFTLLTGVVYRPGDDWAFECIKQRCPTESFHCLLDATCRRFVMALSVGINGSGASCSHDMALDATCGTGCSRVAIAFSACLEREGSACTFATGEPVVVHRHALSETELDLIASLAREQRDVVGNHINRTFGVGGNTTGHVVTWLTPHLYYHTNIVHRLRRLAHDSVDTGRWPVYDLDALSIRCAEVLEYGGKSATGLGWHWDVGSTLTMVSCRVTPDT